MEGSENLAREAQALADLKKWSDAYLEKRTPDPLSNIANLKAGLDLSNASPNGKSRLLSNVKVTLPLLFPNPSLFTAARREFLQILSQCKSEIKQCGFGKISLAAGIARWNGSSRQMPILIYPLEIEEEGDPAKTTIKLGKRSMVNPAFIGAMRDDFGIEFDFSSLPLNLDSGREQFISQVAREVGEMVYGFSAELRFIMGCFINPEVVIRDRALRLIKGVGQGECDVKILKDFLGGKEAVQRPIEKEDLDPHDEKEVGDVPNGARRAAKLASMGQCVFLDAPSSSSSASLALAIASRCACEGKSVIYSSPLGGQKEAFLRYAGKEGIKNLVLDVDERDFAKEIDAQLSNSLSFKNEEAVTNFNRIADELVGVRARLSKYFGDLHKKVEPWDLSAYQVLEKLLLLGSKKSRPSNRVRLDEDVAKNLKGKLGEASEKLERFGELGGFSLTPRDTPWYKASIFTPEEAQKAQERVERISSSLLPEIKQQAASAVRGCGFPEASTVEEWGKHVTMLNNLRRAMDLFSPDVFDLDFPSVLEATKSKEERKDSQLGFWERKKLVKEAKGCLKPGAKVEDLHGTLQAVFLQYQRWRSYSSIPKVTIPKNLDAMVSNLETLNSDLTALDSILPASLSGNVLSSGKFDAIEAKISDLKRAEKSLETLPERESLEKELREMGLGELIEELKSRKLNPSFAGDELELAWYASVFDLIVQSSPLIASQDGHLLAETAQRFIELDRSHVSSAAALIESSCMSRLSEFLYSNADEANDWHSRLSSPSFDLSLAQFEAECPDLLRLAKPIIASTPASIATALPNKALADVLIIDGCQDAESAEIMSLLPLARSCVIVSDLGLSCSPIVSALSSFMQRVEVKRWARCDERLQTFLSDCGVERVLLPPAFGNEPGIAGHPLSGQGVPLRSSDLVESTNQEAEYVAKLAAFRLSQTPLSPSYHLTVIALNPDHAESVAEAVKKMGVREKCPDLVSSHISVEDISNVAAAQKGDVIITAGYAKMGDGRLMQQFGRIQEEGGEKLLLSALCLAERKLDVVSSFRAKDLDEARLTPGTKLLKDLISWAQNPPSFLPPSPCAPSNTLVQDLEERVEREGYGAESYLGYKDGVKIPLAVGKGEGQLDLAVFTDDARFMSIPSMRLRYRGLPDLLSPMGWGSVFAWSVGMFIDPDREIEKVARALNAINPRGRSVGIGDLEDDKG
ncbi:MAG: hypothetical protein IKT06_03560 [Aeriscardovia sp.]|nr:hypothetical protein [Aeriscardovia sp.]